jgi:hypothetical protein
MRTVDEQVNQALRSVLCRGDILTEERWHGIQQAMRDLLAGKFAEDPVPEIVKPRWAADAWVHSNVTTDCGHPYETFYVEANEHRRGQPCASSVYMIGPSRQTAREAILAFNELICAVKP